MLVLTRKYQEKIRIGDGITITILRAKGKAVRLGIEAPPNVPVIRGELSFNQESTATIETPAQADGEAASVPAIKRARRAPVAQNWTPDSRPAAKPRGRAATAAPSVSMGRVPRDKKTEILPQLLSGEGPLRHLMAERARAV